MFGAHLDMTRLPKKRDQGVKLNNQKRSRWSIWREHPHFTYSLPAMGDSAFEAYRFHVQGFFWLKIPSMQAIQGEEFPHAPRD